MSIDYADSTISAKSKSRSSVAKNLKVGERFYSAQVVNAASATPDQLTTRIPFTGAYRVLIFAGNIAEKEPMERLNRLAAYLDGPESPVSKYTPSNLPRWSVIDPITIRKLRIFALFAFEKTRLMNFPNRFFPSNLSRASRLTSTIHLSSSQLQTSLCR